MRTAIERIIRDNVRKADKVIESIEEENNGFLIYLSWGATLGEAIDVQEELIKQGFSIPDQMGNALIFVTKAE